MSRRTLRFPAHDVRSELHFQRGGLDRVGALVTRSTGSRRAFLVTDRRVDRLYAARAEHSLRRAGMSVTRHVVPVGERSKSPLELTRLWSALARADVGRADVLVALGGGVVGDLAGFAAATWLRGVPWVGVPTTLLAQVDSSVGGKTAVDLREGKNLVGAFHQPVAVLLDAEVLATLPVRHRRAGLAEVVKTGWAVDSRLFRWLEAHVERLARGDAETLAEAVRRSALAKARVVMADEREREGGGRTALNFGHTLGHAIEAVLGYRRLLHGEAVAVGMRVAGEMSVRQAGLERASLARMHALLDAFLLPDRIPALRVNELLAAMQRDKKRGRVGVRWVLTPRMGDASVPRVVSRSLVRAVLLAAGARG